MTGRLRVALGVALGSGFVACTKTAEAPTHDSAADKAAIEAVGNRAISAMNSGVTDSVMAVNADDIVVMPNHAEAVSGSVAVRAWQEKGSSQSTMTARLTSSSAEVSGDLGADQFAGELTVTFKAPGIPPVTEKIKGIRIYRRQADGSWKITKVIWNGHENAPAPT